ncbi:MAG: hypothetical protein MI920_36010 [Kiloniellales bacterium]|nr:hypothetical protein [Kiloniellales bacterium]
MDDTTGDTPRQDATEHVRSRPDADLSRYSLTPNDARSLFADAGLPLRLRTVQRYCRQAKLDCLKIDPETQEPTEKANGVYIIEEESVRKRIGDMLDHEAFSGTTRRDKTRPIASDHDQSRQDAISRDTPASPSDDIAKEEASQPQTDDLKDKLVEAEIRAAGHKAVAEQMRRDRDLANERLRETDRVVGVFQDRIMRLGGDPTFPELPNALPGGSQREKEAKEKTGNSESAPN